MTSNLASEEIANYAQDLRREEEKKPPLLNSTVSSGREALKTWISEMFTSMNRWSWSKGRREEKSNHCIKAVQRQSG